MSSHSKVTDNSETFDLEYIEGNEQSIDRGHTFTEIEAPTLPRVAGTPQVITKVNKSPFGRPCLKLENEEFEEYQIWGPNGVIWNTDDPAVFGICILDKFGDLIGHFSSKKIDQYLPDIGYKKGTHQELHCHKQNSHLTKRA